MLGWTVRSAVVADCRSGPGASRTGRRPRLSLLHNDASEARADVIEFGTEDLPLALQRAGEIGLFP